MPDRKNQSGIRMWSFSDMSLSAASKIGDIANIALLISLVAGVISTFVIVKTSDVKERHWDVLRDQARISIADANARALEAQAQLAQFKAPRTMTEAQARHFVEEASKYSGTQADIWIIGDAPEPTVVGQNIFRLLKISGWKTDCWNLTGGGAVIGVAVAVKDASSSDIDQVANALVGSLNAAGVASSRFKWEADWEKFPGILNGPPFSAAAPIRIVIGTKPQQ